MTDHEDQVAGNLRAINRATTLDWMLSRIAWLADFGFPCPVTLMLNGGILAGDTARAEAAAEPIDSAIHAGFDHAEAEHAETPPSDPAELATFKGVTPGDYAHMREQWKQGVFFGPTIAQRREQDVEAVKEIQGVEGRDDVSFHDLSPEAQAWLETREGSMPVLTLIDVVWTPPMGGPISLDFPVRVAVRNVHAWWFGRAPKP